MGSNPKVHSFDEVAKHNSRTDCWLIISGAVHVYDVTPFLEDHLGGDEVLLNDTGKDATHDFEDVGHSDSAKEMMEKYYIGKVDSSTLPAKKPKKNQQSSTSARWCEFYLALASRGFASHKLARLSLAKRAFGKLAGPCPTGRQSWRWSVIGHK